jgi:hypothetical protein
MGIGLEISIAREPCDLVGSTSISRSICQLIVLSTSIEPFLAFIATSHV